MGDSNVISSIISGRQKMGVIHIQPPAVSHFLVPGPGLGAVGNRESYGQRREAH